MEVYPIYINLYYIYIIITIQKANWDSYAEPGPPYLAQPMDTPPWPLAWTERLHLYVSHWHLLLMEKILHRLGCPKSIFMSNIKPFSGIISGAGCFPSTVWPHRIIISHHIPEFHTNWILQNSWDGLEGHAKMRVANLHPPHRNWIDIETPTCQPHVAKKMGKHNLFPFINPDK